MRVVESNTNPSREDITNILEIQSQRILAEMFPLIEERKVVSGRVDHISRVLMMNGIPPDPLTVKALKVIQRMAEKTEELLHELQGPRIRLTDSD